MGRSANCWRKGERDCLAVSSGDALWRSALLFVTSPLPECRQEPRVFSTWAPKALAGIGVKCLQPATRTRCIIIEPERAVDADDFEPLTEIDTIENPWPDLARRLARWADDFPRAAGGNVDVAGLARRSADNWRPLFAIAEALAGDWPDRAREAAKELSNAKRVVNEDVKVQLLSDLRDIFGERERMYSEDIVASLVALEDRPWTEWKQGKPLSKTALARLLKDLRCRRPSRSRWIGGTSRATSAPGLIPSSSAIWPRRGMTKRQAVRTRMGTGIAATLDRQVPSST
jgi:uncharacterized protein DUF3631